MAYVPRRLRKRAATSQWLLKVPPPLTAEQAEQIKRQWLANFGRGSTAMVVPNTMPVMRVK